MSALQELLLHLGDRRHADNSHHRALLALRNRLDLLQDATVAAKRTAFGDVVDGAIAPDGRAFFVERNDMGQTRLYAWENSPLGSDRLKAVAAADFISLCGFPNGKDLAFVSVKDGMSRLHLSEWTSEPIRGRIDNGTIFWKDDHRVFAVINSSGPGGDRIEIFQVGHEKIASLQKTRVHAVLHGELIYLTELPEGKTSVSAFFLRLASTIDLLPSQIKRNLVRFPKPDRQPTVFARERLEENVWYEHGGPHGPRRHAKPFTSEGRLFHTEETCAQVFGNAKPWSLMVESCDEHAWSWNRTRSNVGEPTATLRALCFLPDSGETALLLDPNAKREDARFEVVFVDKYGKERANECVENVTGKMRRIGDRIAVEGRDAHGPTVSLFRAGSEKGRTMHPLVGAFDRLTALDDGSVAGWHYANGVVSLQRYV